MSVWTKLYPQDMEPFVNVPTGTLSDAWRERVEAAPDAAAIRYFDAVFTARESDELSNALAAELQIRGVQPGDFVGIQLQNIPQFALMMLALWKVGASPLVLNPMYRRAELTTIFEDSRPVGVVGVGGPAETTVKDLQQELGGWYLRTSEDGMLAPGGAWGSASGPEDELAHALVARRGERPQLVERSPDDTALLTYTSGTTGPPKGTIGTHRNLLNTVEATRLWFGVDPGDRVLAVAPLFHITGAVATGAMALIAGAELVFIGRLSPDVFLDAISRYQIHHVLGSITVYNALLDLDHGGVGDLATLKTVFSGGAPVPPATVERFQRRFGHYIRNAYGMTETASAVVAVPRGRMAPVDEASGTLAIGVAFPGTEVRVRAEDGTIAAPGDMGELELKGASCTPGYLNKPEATASTIEDGWLKTGDIAILDEAGWIYLVDRKKDQINVSGFKVWPREVEDVLYEHPAVREAAVRGRPHPYSGEEVVAFVSLQSEYAERSGVGVAEGARADAVVPASGAPVMGLEDELRAHVKERLAAYKCPKAVFVVDDLPKTATGKIQRRALDEEAPVTAAR